MRRISLVLGFVLIALGLSLYFALSRSEVAHRLGRGEPVHFLYLLRLIPDAPPDMALVASLSPQGLFSLILIPGTISVPKKGVWNTLSTLYALEGPPALSAAIANLLEISFVEEKEIEPGEWDRLIDELGGVVVRLTERLVVKEPPLSLDLLPGEQLLSSQKTRDFLVYCVHYAEDPSFSLARDFFQEFLARLWAKPKALSGLAASWKARDFWRRVWACPEEGVRLAVLPARPEGARFIPDLVEVRKLRGKLFFGRDFLTRDEVRVVVLNGTQERFLATRTASWLLERGFQVVGVGMADRYDYEHTILVVGAGAAEKVPLLKELLVGEVVVMAEQDFGVERIGGWPKGADLVLILGAGFDVRS